ncbi:MAG: DUF86 domain-containing protein [Bacteroidales bacterium]|nr:DUF86 domain-containing protein [Bacteroidales bacterium]MBP5676938.1 DUF86 domain-containing protein [Bacteroidales bacterium]
MRERARDKGRLEDIIEYSDNVTMLIEGHSLASFVADKSTYYSVMKNVEIVGEAAYMLSKAFKKAHPATPWKTVQGMRHVLVHDYANIVSETLFDTSVNGIPELRKQVEAYLAETDWEAWETMPDDFEDTVDEAMLKLARKMKAKGFVTSDISEMTGLSEDEITNL